MKEKKARRADDNFSPMNLEQLHYYSLKAAALLEINLDIIKSRGAETSLFEQQFFTAGNRATENLKETSC